MWTCALLLSLYSHVVTQGFQNLVAMLSWGGVECLNTVIATITHIQNSLIVYLYANRFMKLSKLIPSLTKWSQKFTTGAKNWDTVFIIVTDVLYSFEGKLLRVFERPEKDEELNFPTSVAVDKNGRVSLLEINNLS